MARDWHISFQIIAMKNLLIVLFTLLLSITGIESKASRANTIKVKATVYNNFGSIEKALAFVYVEDSLVFYVFSDNRGRFTLNLKRDTEYKITVSRPGHITSAITFDTHNMRKDQVKKINFPIRLYNVHDSDINEELVAFTVKWNFIIERFETFDYNMGWKMELQEVKTQATPTEEIKE